MPDLTIVLPAYNEEARIGAGARRAVRLPPPARRHCRARASPDSSNLPGRHPRPRRRRRQHRRARPTSSGPGPRRRPVSAKPGSDGPWKGAWLDLLTVPHGGKGAAVRAGMLAADGDLVVFADADMATPPDQLPLLVEALADRDVALGSRIQPDGSDMRRTQPGLRRLLGQGLPPARRRLGQRTGPRHPVRLQGVPRPRPPTTCSAASRSRASSSTSSSSTSPAGAAIAWPWSRSSGPTGAARGCTRAPASPCGSPGTSSGSRSSIAAVGRRP